MRAAALLRRTNPATFSPAYISGLALWLKADAITGLADADPVSSWADQSGNARNFTGVTTTRPLYRTGVLNGKPAVRFDGVDDVLTGPTLASLTAGEVFLVVKLTNDPPLTANSSGLWHVGVNGADPFPNTHYPFTDGIIYDAFGSTTRKATVNPTPSLAAWRLYNVNSVDGEWTSRLDGTQLFSTATNVAGFPAVPKLGNSITGGLYFLGGDIAELFIYDRKVTAAERAQVNAYVAAKYALTIA